MAWANAGESSSRVERKDDADQDIQTDHADVAVSDNAGE
jgi:hypothetical protein